MTGVFLGVVLLRVAWDSRFGCVGHGISRIAMCNDG